MIEPFVHAGIIEPHDLNTLMQRPDVPLRLVDATFVLPGSPENPHENFKKERIGKAVFFDVDEVSDKDSPLPHMLPGKKEFEKAVSDLGIGNDDFVVVYGQHGMLLGPARLWWMFRVFGHDNVVVLNGGLPAWKAEGFEIKHTPPPPHADADFTVQEYRDHLVTNMHCVKEISESGACPILDARPLERFEGKAPEPRAGMRSGHIPGSQSVPCSSLIDTKTGKLEDKSALKAFLQEKGVNFSSSSSKVVATCGSGITACVITLALYHLGHDDFCVYDGSWSEWGRADSPTNIICLYES